MALADAITARFHTLSQACLIDGRSVRILGGMVDFGWDTPVSAVVLKLRNLESWIQFATEVKVSLGWNGYMIPVARALIQATQPDWFPLKNEIKASGYLSRAKKPYAGTLTYSSQTDTAIVTDLLSKANIPNVSIAGAGTVLASLSDYLLTEGESKDIWSAIEDVDLVTGYKTFEVPPDGIVRRVQVIPGIPASTYSFSFQEGINETSIKRVRTIEKLYNRVKVTGLPGLGITTQRRADSPFVDRDVTYSVSSELIQTQAISDDVATRTMQEVNRVVDTLEIVTPLDPRLSPGQTCRVKNPTIGIAAWTNYYIRHINHAWGEGGAWTTVTVEGGLGQAGAQFAEPIASFIPTITKEQFDIAGVSTTMYTVMCDSSSSFDPDGSIASYAWSNNKNADVGTSIFYATMFTAAQIATIPTITLIVTDNDGYTDTLVVNIDTDSYDVVTRDLYSAADLKAESTPDGGVTFNTNTPASGTVIATPQIAAEDHSYFGYSDGKLRYTVDHLATAPTLVHTFAAKVDAIWINEMDPNRVAVGCDDGKVFSTSDASNLAAATWVELYDFGSPILWIMESPYQFGQYRVAVDENFWITYDSFGNIAVFLNWDPTDIARACVLTPFANYYCATVLSGSGVSPVKREDGVQITFPDGTTDVRAITHHIHDDIAYCAALDVNGTTANIYSKAAGATAFTKISTIASAGQPNSMVRDGDNPLIIYLTCNQGLYKTFDGGIIWYRMRNYTGAGLNGLQIGYGSITWLPVTALEVISAPTASDAGVKCSSLGALGSAPTGWLDELYNDSAWDNAVVPSNLGGNTPLTGTSAIWNDILYAVSTERVIYRHKFALSTGVPLSVQLKFRADDLRYGAWLNNSFLGQDLTAKSGGVLGSDLEVSVSPSILRPGQDNVLGLEVQASSVSAPAAPTYVRSGTGQWNNIPNKTLNMGSVTAGDLIVLYLQCDRYQGATGSTDNGWTKVYDGIGSPAVSNNFNDSTWYRFQVGGDSGTYTQPGVGDGAFTYIYSVYRSVPITYVATYAHDQGGAGTTATAPSVSPVLANTLVVSCFGLHVNNKTLTGPGGAWTTRLTQTDWRECRLADQVSAGGVTGAASVTWSTNQYWNAIQVFWGSPGQVSWGSWRLSIA